MILGVVPGSKSMGTCDDVVEFCNCFIQEVEENSQVQLDICSEKLLFIGINDGLVIWNMPERGIFLSLPGELVDRDFVISRCMALNTHQAALITELHNIYFDDKYDEYEPEYLDLRTGTLC